MAARKPNHPLVCRCGAEFWPTNNRQKWCSGSCYQRAYQKTWRKKNPTSARRSQYRWRSKNQERWKFLKKQSYRRKHPERQPANPLSGRAWHLKRYYGLTIDEYQRMWDTQGGLCAVCRLPETQTSRNGVVKSLSVDHDHDTGEVRALLCQTCNTGIGNLKDDPDLMRRAAEYIESWNG